MDVGTVPPERFAVQAADASRDLQAAQTKERPLWQRPWVVPLMLALIVLALTTPRLETPPVYVFDELYYAYTAGLYVAGDPRAYDCCKPPRARPAIEWTHPPVAKLIIAAGIWLFGDNPLGWRAMSVLFGVAGVLITYVLALSLTGSRAVAALASLLLLIDGVYFVESRIGMSNLFLLVFTNAALLAFARVLAGPPQRTRGALLATGACLGLAIATKWSAIALLGLIGLVYLWRAFRRPREGERDLLSSLVWGAVAFAIIPATIYLLSYGHFFLTGHTWSDLISLHRSMFEYHRNLGIVHPYTSSWWEWPLAARPVWYYAVKDGAEGAFVFVNGNPLLYWPMVIAAAWVAIDWWGRKPVAFTILLIGFFGQWLPWALSPRGTFIYHFLPAVPLGCIAIAVVLWGAWQADGWQRPLAVAYVVAVVLVFGFFYPLYTAVPMTPQQVDLRIWLPSWR